MSLKQLDYLFPFIVFGYGAITLFVLNHPKLVELAEKHMPHDAWQTFQSRRILAFLCLAVGGLWALQNLWLG